MDSPDSEKDDSATSGKGWETRRISTKGRTKEEGRAYRSSQGSSDSTESSGRNARGNQGNQNEDRESARLSLSEGSADQHKVPGWAMDRGRHEGTSCAPAYPHSRSQRARTALLQKVSLRPDQQDG